MEVGQKKIHILVVPGDSDAGVLEVGVAVEIKTIGCRGVGFALHQGRFG